MKEIKPSSKNCALILGGGFNGYITTRELAECGVTDLYLTDTKRDYAFFSNKLTKTFIQPADAENVSNLINQLSEKYETVVIFPVSDVFITCLDDALSRIKNNHGVIYNPETIHTLFKKSEQYEFCSKNNIAYPKTLTLKEYLENENNDLQYPLLLKPNYCDSNNYGKVFKTMVVETAEELDKAIPDLTEYLQQGIELLITELIPGGDTDLYGYVAYRSKEGEILSEWGWKKLSQFPEGHGVFASISNQCPDEVLTLGRDIFEKMNLMGICEIEFKYDARDGKYKYIETNFRTPMLSRLGHICGTSSCYAQYLDCTGEAVPSIKQRKDIDIHFVLFQAELINFLRRPAYISKMFRNIFNSGKTYFAIFDIRDPLPAVFNVLYTLTEIKEMIKRFK